ncbi:MAG: serine hydrolase [Pseudomonadota bacterium]
MKLRILILALVSSFSSACNSSDVPTAPKAAGDPISQLEARIADDTFKQINGIVVLKEGEVVLERYFNGTSPDDLHNPRSVGKTFASAMVGIALRDGYLKSVDQTLDEFYRLEDYENFDPRKGKVSIQQLLTMTSGFEGFDFEPDSIGNEENMYPQDNWVAWTLDLPMASDRNPGEKWYYFTAGVVVLGDILHRVLPGGLEAYAKQELFDPLGITNLQWQYTPQQVANTAGGLQLSARDFAKFGQLYKNKGVWQDKQIIPEAFVVDSFKQHAVTTEDRNDYGYLWWKTYFDVNETRLSPSYASGNGGNKIYVFNEIPVVISITASAYGQRYGHRQIDQIMREYLLPWVMAEQ